MSMSAHPGNPTLISPSEPIDHDKMSIKLPMDLLTEPTDFNTYMAAFSNENSIRLSVSCSNINHNAHIHIDHKLHASSHFFPCMARLDTCFAPVVS